jgi:hypothetical protein
MKCRLAENYFDTGQIMDTSGQDVVVVEGLTEARFSCGVLLQRRAPYTLGAAAGLPVALAARA